MGFNSAFKGLNQYMYVVWFVWRQHRGVEL